MIPTPDQWKEEFRKLLNELNDLNDHHATDHPIKGDMYFDGIEIEQFISTEKSKSYEEGRREVLGEVREMVEGMKMMGSAVNDDYNAAFLIVLSELNRIQEK